MEKYIERAESTLLHTYNRYQIVLDKAKDVYLYDINGKQYLDFMSGIGVFALGYGNEELNHVIKEQVDKLTHTSNMFYNVPAIEAAEKIKKISGMDRVFFTNSGAEAIEGAIKAARKYAYNKDGMNDHEIIALNHSFHGRTMGAVSITGKKAYREAFEPMIGYVKFAEMNDIDSVKSQITDKTCAIFMETVQGEGGIYPAEKEFIEEIYQICQEKDILLVLDEIQCGMGRCGSYFAWQQYDVKPDIMTTAKALGSGLPVGAFLLGEKVAKSSLVAGDHGTTYGGNPLVCAAVNKTLDLFEENNIIEHVTKVGAYLEEALEKVAAKNDCIVEHRGKGLMHGLEFNKPVSGIIASALDKGLILISAGTNVIRFLPPLVIENEHVDTMISILQVAIAQS